VRDDIATETSEPFDVVMDVTGPFGSGPTGGAEARAENVNTSAARSDAVSVTRSMRTPYVVGRLRPGYR
jgi:hypothetical protein